MMIAGEYTFPLRSLAPARSLLPHSLRGAWICAIFISSFFRYPIRGGGGDDGVAVFLLGVSSLGPSCGPCSRFSSMFIVHCSLFIRAVAGRTAASFPVSPLASCLVPSNHPPRCPLPHSLRSYVSFLVPSCVSLIVSFSCRLVSRSVLIPSRLSRCAGRIAARLAVALFCSARFFVLPMPCRHHRLTTG